MDDKTKKIVDSVTKLYHEYGIKGVTMDDVAHRLSISKKTLYEHFKDKKDLVLAVLEHARKEWDCHFSSFECKDCSAIDELFHFYEIQVKMIRSNRPAFVYDLKKYYPEVYSNFHKIKQKLIFENFVNNIKKGKIEGLYRDDINGEIISKLNLMRFEGILDSEYFTIEELLSTELFTEIFKYHLFGIVSDKGRDIVNQKFSNNSLKST
ncbi:MAG: TetR/AcrR family transcriptional regulator [Bacteroidetes bacterium]|nr:TetR/AcrR family transcriptional regulator [Bacteroidota bacterium]